MIKVFVIVKGWDFYNTICVRRLPKCKSLRPMMIKGSNYKELIKHARDES